MPASQADKGIVTISATRYPVEIQVPSSSEAAMPPWMSFSAAFVIWMSSTAMKAPRIAPKIAIQSRALGCHSRCGGEFIAAPLVSQRGHQRFGAFGWLGAGVDRGIDRQTGPQ